MSVFDAALDTLYADPNLAVDAVYTPPGGGAPVPCRTDLSAGDRDWRAFSDSGVTLPAISAEVRVSDVMDPEEGGTLAVGGSSYRITRVTQPGTDRRLWRLELQ